MKVGKIVITKEVIWLNSALTTFFILITFFSPFRPTDELLFFNGDSKEYFSTGIEFFKLSETGASIIRPFLYSSILRFLHFFGGAWLVVIFQFMCWLLSANLIYFTIKNRFKPLKIRIIALTVFAINLSLIGYTFTALTEVISTLLLAILTFITLTKENKTFDANFYLKILLLLSLLTVIKPLFYLPFIAFGVVGAFIVIRKKVNPKFFVYLALVISPVILQVSVMKIKYNVLKVSTIDTLTFDNYLMAQGIREIESISDITESQNMAKSFEKSEKIAYLWEHKSTYLRLYLTNLKENVDAYESNFLYPNFTIECYYDFMDQYNDLFYWMSFVFLIGYCWFFVIFLLKRKITQHWQLFFLGLLLYYIIFASGISFWQADRLVIFSIPLWITSYILILSHSTIRNFIEGKNK